MTQEMYDAAYRYWRSGLSVLPISPGSKLPLKRDMVRRFSHSHATAEHLREWFLEGDAQIGIICGPISGDLLVFDFESRAAADIWLQAASLDAEHNAPFPVVHTGHGTHVYMSTRHPLMHQAHTTLAALGGSILIETRGAGGYVLAPPSLHPSGARYELVAGKIAQFDLPILYDPEIEQLIGLAQQMSTTGVPAGVPTGVPLTTTYPIPSAWPLGIPEHAQRVRRIGGYWFWEFIGGAILCVGCVGPDGQIAHAFQWGREALTSLLDDLDQNRERMRNALAEQAARDAAYDNYLDGLHEAWDEEDEEL